MKRALAVLLVSALTLALTSSAKDRITGSNFVSRSEVIAQNAMVATSHPLVSQIALDILRKGGSAVDAAIAANAALGLMEPTGSGIGGDLFAIVWDAERERLYGLNASGRSPESLTIEHFAAEGLTKVPSHGPLPVTVPGCVDGWFELHRRFGKLPMSEVLAPAVAYARNGFPVTELISYYWNRSVPILEVWPGFSDTFMPNGRAPRTGDIFRNPALANTYERLGEEGRDLFYSGEFAHNIADFMQANGGFLSYDDMAAHTSEWVKPMFTNYRGYDVWELPPNGQGIAALQMLNMLEAYDIAAMGFGSAEYIHTFVEVKKLVFEDRAKFYADTDFNEIPVDELLTKSYADERRKLIGERAALTYEAGNPALRAGDTVYLTTADSNGNMVSLIQSNYRGMGSGMSPPGLGFILQDRGELFDLEPGHFNSYAPGKRPFHTIIPAFITRDGRPWMSFGVMGGAMQPQGHVQIVINMIDFGMNLQEAGDAPRIRHSGSSQPTGEVMSDGGTVFLESGVSFESRRVLMQMGHRVRMSVGGYGGYQAILYDAARGVYFGASESRKDGHAVGY